MPISSASTRIFKAEDPVMETDLQLLAKVNTYEQEKFDEGAKELQNEVNNWSLLANVAKDQDKAYINSKLTNLVSGIQQLGGVNLADHNNVNALKSQGYNLYGDDNVMNPVLTTRRMQALQQSIHDNTSGKNAKDYDSVYGEYLLNQYSDWLNDGKQGTKFDGPTELPQGSFDQYNKKVQDTLNKLKPDINEAPIGKADKMNYLQVGDKFIKRERVWAAIEANTSEQDKNVLRAHAWKSMNGLPDINLINMQRQGYDASLKELMDNRNELNYQKSLVKTDFKQTALFDSQIDQVNNAMSAINGQKNSLPQLQEGQSLPKEMRENLRDNLFMSAYKTQMSNAFAYEQKKTELKVNQGKVAELKMAQSAYQFGLTYGLRDKEFKLKERAQKFKEDMTTASLSGWYGMNSSAASGIGVNGPAQSALLSVMPNLGKDDATVMNDEVRKQADANFIAKSKNLYSEGYDYLMKKDSELYSKYLQLDPDSGRWVPKDDNARAVLDKGLQSAIDLYGNIANMALWQRNGLKLSDDDLNFYKSSSDVKQAQLYKDQITDLTNQVFIKAGQTPPSQKTIKIKFKDKDAEGKDEVNVTYDKLKEMQERGDPLLQKWKERSKSTDLLKQVDAELSKIPPINPYITDRTKYLEQVNNYNKSIRAVYDKYGIKDRQQLSGVFNSVNQVDAALNNVDSYYNQGSVKSAWEDLSKTFNVYGRTVTLPKIKGKTPEILQNDLGNLIRKDHPDLPVQDKDIDLKQIWTVYKPDAKGPNKVRYMAKAVFQVGTGGDKGEKADRGDKLVTIDVTDRVVADHNSTNGGYLGNLFADDDAQVVYGMMLNNKGATPFDARNNYAGAMQTQSNGKLVHKYQVVRIPNGNNGVEGYKVNILIPKGTDLRTGNPVFQTMPVPNFFNNSSSFESNLKYVQQYMDYFFKDDEHAKEFYQRLGVPYTLGQDTNIDNTNQEQETQQ